MKMLFWILKLIINFTLLQKNYQHSIKTSKNILYAKIFSKILEWAFSIYRKRIETEYYEVYTWYAAADECKKGGSSKPPRPSASCLKSPVYWSTRSWIIILFGLPLHLIIFTFGRHSNFVGVRGNSEGWPGVVLFLITALVCGRIE